MAKRELQEINAGSMADIAFLLLIFFLVTTTMEVDAGISRQLPLKRELPPDFEYPEVHARDVLVIKANSNDQLLVEGKRRDIEDLEGIVMDFYTVNINGERDPNMPVYKEITISKCQKMIADLTTAKEENPGDIYFEEELEKWKTKLELCKELGGRYDEIAPMAMIRLENQSGTSYGLYIQIQNILKRVVNQLRAEKCDEYFQRDYYKLDPKNEPGDEAIVKKLRVLVPERIIEAKIEK